MSVTTKRYAKFFMWFILLSTFGVGGGIFFLLFAVVPIEQVYEDRGWSQFKIDSIMKYYVIGWVVFGFIVSFLYYFFVLKKNYWKTGIGMMIASILLSVIGMYYFLNTGTGVVQTSQGEVVESGERFTFGPYPEQADLKRLADQGYDGVITLLSPTLPIEKPLLDKELKNGEKAGIDIISMPMLPWVGDNTATLNAIKKLIKKDDKRYYVHCYLGRHRVDIVKQLVNQELKTNVKVLVRQRTSLERGPLIVYTKQNVLVGPYPTDEEWLTRIRRSEVKEFVSLLPTNETMWLEKEKKVAAEMGVKFTHIPLAIGYSKQDLQKVIDYVKGRKDKVYVHDFNGAIVPQFDAMFDWDKTINTWAMTLAEQKKFLVGAKIAVGPTPNATVTKRWKQLGVEQFVEIPKTSLAEQYKLAQKLKEQKQLTYAYTDDVALSEQFKRMQTGIMFGAYDDYKLFDGVKLTNGTLEQIQRNVVVGPILTEKEFATFAIANGFSKIIFLNSATLAKEDLSKDLENYTKQYNISIKQMIMKPDFQEKLINSVNKETGYTYIMVDEFLIQTVVDYLKRY